LKSQEILKKVQGIHWDSKLFLSLRNATCDPLEVRMAREEDHDDLAEIFNSQSEVLTAQFGEFFIADLIANQNQTRRNTANVKSDGRALVAQVKKKAVGLMSLSTDIDYKLLGENFDLEIYDNLFKPELMSAIRDRRAEILEENKYKNGLLMKEKAKRIKDEIMQCKWKGQRLCLQQYMQAKDAEIKFQLDNFITNKEQAKTLNKLAVEKMIDQWVSTFQFNQPSSLFLDPAADQDPELFCIIQTNRQFFLETLVFFGLPKNYIFGEGHWKDWEEKILNEQKAQSLRRPMKKKLKTARAKKKDEEEKKDEMKPPSYFDLSPLMTAFNKFTSCTPDLRATFMREIEQNYKKFITLFTDVDGVLIETRCVDLNTMGSKLAGKGLTVNPAISDNLAAILECFGDIGYTENLIKIVPEKSEEPALLGGIKKNIGDKNAMKKLAELQEAPKPIDFLQKLVSYKDFISAFKTMKDYDLTLCRLGFIKSDILKEELVVIKEKEEFDARNEEKRRGTLFKNLENNEYRNLVKDPDNLTEIPINSQNAIVINLFCIDENYESRSIDFLKYAFKLFPDREYIILTQPHTIPESSLLQPFSQIPKKQASSFDHVLYLIHKDSLLFNNLVVRRAKISDVFELKPFFSDLANKDQIEKDMFEGIKDLSSRKVVFSVFCQDMIIGMYVLSKNVNLPYYSSHFCLQDHIILSQHTKDSHSRLIHAILNPLFTRYTRFILKEILRLTNKTVLYFETHERTLLPDIFHELNLVRSRTFPHFLERKWDFQHDPEFFEKLGDKQDLQDGDRDAFDQLNSDFSLSILTKRQLSVNKVNNNTRILVVGASDTGISFLESLLSIREVRFAYLTVLAPGGLLTINCRGFSDLLKGISSNYTFQEIRNLMLDARVNVLDSKMVALDKKAKRIVIENKKSFLNYDVLVVTVGLIDTELQNRELISTGVYVNNLTKEPINNNNNNNMLASSNALLNNTNNNNSQNLATSANLNPENKCKIGVFSIDDPYLYRFFKTMGRKDGNLELLLRKKKPQYIAIYGRTLHTIAMINGLLNRGVEGNRIQYIIPPKTFQNKTKFTSNQERNEYEDLKINDPDPFENEEILAKIFTILRSKDVKIYQDYGVQDLIVDPKSTLQALIIKRKRTKEEIDELTLKQQEKAAALASLNSNPHSPSYNSPALNSNPINNEDFQPIEEDEYLELNVRFLITSGIIDIDKEIFNIIHENGLVYNGRLIIKSNFQTTDPVIFACGRICEFSQRYKNQAVGTSLRLDKYNGRELGQKLAKSVLDSLDLSHLFDAPITSEEEIPSFSMPKGVGAFLPGNLLYYHVKRNDFFRPKVTLAVEKNRKDMVSDNFHENKGQFLSFSLDNNGIIESVSYLGSEFVSVQSLASFVGLSESYLNQLEPRSSKGLIPNISEFLSQNWAIALYHEWFSGFRHLVKNEIVKNEKIKELMAIVEEKAKDGGFLEREAEKKLKKEVPKEVVAEVKQAMVEFLRNNQNHLPMYFVPQKK